MSPGTWIFGVAAALALVVCAPAGAAWSPPSVLDPGVRTDDPSVALAIDARGRAVVTTLLSRNGPGCRGRCGGRVAVEGAGARRLPALAAGPALLADGTALALRERPLPRSRAELALRAGPIVPTIAEGGTNNATSRARFRRLERYDAMQFASRARLAATPAGDAVVAWIAERGLRGGPLRVVVRRRGGRFGRRVTLSRRSVNALAVVVSPRGDALVAYQRAGRVVARVRAAGGSRFGAPQDLGPGGRGSAAAPATATDGAGRLLVAWTAPRAGRGRATLRIALAERGGRFGAARTVTDNASALDTPQAALGGDGTVAVGWNAPAPAPFTDPVGRVSVARGAGPFQAQDVPAGLVHALAAAPDGTMLALVGTGALVKPPKMTRFGPPEAVGAAAVVAADAAFAPDGTAVAAWRTPDGAIQLSRRTGR